MRKTRKQREVAHMTDSMMKALDTPEGEEVLRQMVDKEVAVPEGLAKLLVLSGEYEPRETTRGDQP
jgi:hypothetical protein